MPDVGVEDIVDTTGKLISQQPAYDKMINAEVLMQQGEDMVKCVVKRRSLRTDGRIHGTYSEAPFSNSIIYDVEFSDGQVKKYSVNLIAENIISQVNSDGYSASLMEVIVDHKKDETAVPIDDKLVVDKNGKRHYRKTTESWKLLVKWKDD